MSEHIKDGAFSLLIVGVTAAVLSGGWLLAPWAAEQPRPQTIRGRDGMVMVLIPAGEFIMGCPDGEPDERPPHKVWVDAFYLDEHEVTNAQFLRFVGETNYKTEAERKGQAYIWDYGWKLVQGANWRHPEGPDSSIEGRMDHPVVHLSWADAQAYARHYGKQLPTEAQWEYAARGGRGWRYAYGNEYDPTKANVNTEGTRPVKSYPPNPFGLYDMTGNVWEWCRDWYAPDYYQHSPQRNPPGPKEGKWHVCRGGSWASNAVSSRTTSRNVDEPQFGNFSVVGFRCCLPAEGR
ncbi:MAG TPA: formylglycine-generating enzyme family protein [Armatimonadetes bacterium]|nr:formylglycine-generating enzyme family protein [Armatimonadota bacterium]